MSYLFEVPITAPSFAGGGSGLTALNATQLTSGSVPRDRGRRADVTSNGVPQYNGHTRSPGRFYGGTTAPNNTQSQYRMNYDGVFHATAFVGDGSGLTGITGSGGTASGIRLDLYDEWSSNNSSSDDYITVEHNLGTQLLMVQVWWNNAGDYDLAFGVGGGIANLPGFMGVAIEDNNTITVKLSDTPSNLAWSSANYFIHIIPFET